MSVLASLEVLFQDNHQDLVNGLGDVNQGLGETSQSAETSVASLAKIAGTAAGILAVGAAIKAGAEAIYDFAKASVETSLRLGETEQAFYSMSASAEEARSTIAGIRDIAKDSDFGFEELEKAGARMLQLNTASDQVKGTLGAIVNAIGAVEGSADQVNKVIEVFGRMNATGQITTKTLTQLEQAGVRANDILRKELGLTSQQLAKIEKEHLDTSKVMNALIKGMNEATGSGIETAAEKATRAFKNFDDAVTTLQQKIGDKLLPFLADMVTEAAALLDTANKIVDLLSTPEPPKKQPVFPPGFDFGGVTPGPAPFITEPWNMFGQALAAASDALAEFDDLLKLPSIQNELEGIKEDLKKGVTADVDEFGNVVDLAAFGVENLTEEIDTATEATSELTTGHQNATSSVQSLSDTVSTKVVPAMQSAADAANKAASEALRVDMMFDGLQDAIQKLSTSYFINKGAIDNLLPGLEGASDLFEQMRKEIGAAVGGEGPNAINALKALMAQQQGALQLLAVMEAIGISGNNARQNMDDFAASIPSMSHAFDDLLDSFRKHTQATNNVANAMQTVADVQLQSVAAGLQEASGGASSLNSGLAQLGEGLGQYGQMAATGTLPEGLPGGVPNFSGAGTPLMYGGAPRGPVSGGTITNPFGGTDWSGSYTHGWPAIQVQLVGDDQGWTRFLRIQQAGWQSQNSRGVR